jgi:hypothetical protein
MRSLSHSVPFHVMSVELFLIGEEEGEGRANGGFQKLGRRGVGKGGECMRFGFEVQVVCILQALGRNGWLGRRRR